MRRARYSISTFSDENIKEQFQKIINKVIISNEDISIEEKWASFEEATKKAAQVLKEKIRKSGTIWYDNNGCKETVTKRKKARKNMLKQNTVEKRTFRSKNEKYGKNKQDSSIKK